MPTGTVWVDNDLEESGTDELAKELVKRDNWQEAIAAAAQGHDPHNQHSLYADLMALFERASLGKPIIEDVRRIAWDHYGRSVP